jgi:hypothetical protein
MRSVPVLLVCAYWSFLSTPLTAQESRGRSRFSYSSLRALDIKRSSQNLKPYGCQEKLESLSKIYTEPDSIEIPGGGKGAHRKFTHAQYAGAVTLSGQLGDDAKPYQERQVKRAIERVSP